MSRRAPRMAFVLAWCSLPGSAWALDAGKVGDDAVQLDITDATSLVYNVDNRDSKPNQVNTRANDDWGVWYNRLNLQATWGKWTAGVRVDNAWFYRSPYPEAIALDLTEERGNPPGGIPRPVFFRQKLQEAGTELSTRYINWVYPAKYYIGYTTRDVELQLGDSYAQLGRGLVLSVRKSDELASDTTVRGARVTGHVRAGTTRLRLTALAGAMNPLRLDESSGRYLGVDDSVTGSELVVTEAGMPRAVDTDFVPAVPAYAPDRIVAGQIEIAPKGFKLGTQASMLLRQDPLNPDVVRQADRVLTASQSVALADIDSHGDAYLEVAYQSLSDADPDAGASRDLVDPGYAVYGAVTVIELPVSVLIEGKHYRRFFPLRANVDLSRAREFSGVQYSAPPTTGAFWIDTEFEGFNTCVSGGRAKSDVHVGKDESLFAWVGHYYSWAESVSNDACEISDANLNRVWDIAAGAEISSQKRKSRANFTVGGRMDNTDRVINDGFGETRVFYQESYARYDIIRFLGGPYSLQFQGWHRRRRQSFGGADEPWFEGQHLTGLDIAPHFSAAFGVEYDTNPQTPDTYFNGQLTYKFTSASSVSLFAGQRRGALRCVAGVCRIFPPFEGARLDAVFRM
ncbi:MAG: DUF6029 family protein [Polyangiaceae bacterium]